MKKRICIWIMALMMLWSPNRALAGDFFFGLTSEGSNFWFNPIQLPTYVLGTLLGAGHPGTSYDWVTVKDSQGKLDVDNGSYFGFKARDIFNHFGYGVTFGYQPPFSPLGIIGNAGYKFRQFRMQPDRSLENMEKYKLNSWSAGVGVRLTPFMGLLDDKGWSPMMEVGTNYRQVFSCKAPYDNDKEQFGSGFSTHLAVGVRFVDDYNEGGISVSLAFEMPHYDYFNREFVAPDGSKPYEDIKSKNYSIALRLQTEF